jgi:anaerobic selenocysteine-containing dehydrogenase
MMCPASCGILGYLEYGKVIKLGGNPLDPNSRGRLCAKGIAGLNHLYNPERVSTPLRRIGKRGEGRWKPVSWDEALKELAQRLTALQAEGRHRDLVIRNTWDLASNDLAGRFASAFEPANLHPAVLGSSNGHRPFIACPARKHRRHSPFMIHSQFRSQPYETHFLYVLSSRAY